jgi:hypothetical protein
MTLTASDAATYNELRKYLWPTGKQTQVWTSGGQAWQADYAPNEGGHCYARKSDLVRVLRRGIPKLR